MYLKLRNRAFRALRYTESALRVKHFRGHGVHSPFVYAIIRKALMKYKFTSDDKNLYNRLHDELCDRKSARQLQNLYNHCSYSNFLIININNCHSYDSKVQSDLIIVSESVNTAQSDQILEEYLSNGTPVVVIHPRSSKQRLKMCKQHIDSGKYLTIDNRRFIIYYCNNRLPKQHFKL